MLDLKERRRLYGYFADPDTFHPLEDDQPATVTAWCRDDPEGRNMILQKNATFVEVLDHWKGGKIKTRRLWMAPKNMVFNGASKPRFWWRVAGTPFTGLERDASTFHDAGCIEQSVPSEVVHMMFWRAMMANGVHPFRAGMMYQAVYRFGHANFRPSDETGYQPPAPFTIKKCTAPYGQEAGILRMGTLKEMWDENGT